MLKEVLEGKARSDPGFPGRTAYELCARYQCVYERLSVIGGGIACR